MYVHSVKQKWICKVLQVDLGIASEAVTTTSNKQKKLSTIASANSWHYLAPRDNFWLAIRASPNTNHSPMPQWLQLLRNNDVTVVLGYKRNYPFEVLNVRYSR